MSATGHAILNFGAFPGSDGATLQVTGQSAILATSFVEAWLDPTQGATADHSVDEQIAESGNLAVTCSNIVAGTGFTINLRATGGKNEYGHWNVSWVWQ